MRLSNTENIVGFTVAENLGLVTGNMVQSKHVGRDILAGLKSIVGGEIRDYTKMLDEARTQAQSRMIYQAEKLGADAIINILAIAQTMSELLAYGTAVKLLKIESVLEGAS